MPTPVAPIVCFTIDHSDPIAEVRPMPPSPGDSEKAYVKRASALYGPGFTRHLRNKGFTDATFLHHWAAACSVFERMGLGKRVLDVGCGPGWSSIFLAGRGCRVTAVDVSPDMLEVARENAARLGMSIDFRQADMQTSLPREEFDSLVILDALHHCRNEAAALRNCFGALRAGGGLVLIEPDWFHEFSPSAKRDRRRFETTERGMGFTRVRRALKSAGFRRIRRYYSAFDTPSGNIFSRLRSLAVCVATLTVGFPRRPVIATAVKPPADCQPPGCRQ